MKNPKFKIQNLLVIIFLFLIPASVLATNGLVPCGGPGQPSCQLCHLFVLIDKVIDFVLKNIVIPVAILILVIGGVMFFAAAGNPEKLATAKNLITSVVISLVVIFGAFLLIGTFLNAMGLANWTKNIYQNWWQQGFFQIPCP